MFDAIVELLSERNRKEKRADLASAARRQFGGKGG